MVIQWTEALAVGVPDVDAQHQELFRRAERLVHALRSGDRSEVVPLVASLDDWAAKHFATEERLMAEARYPGLERHAAAHRAFRAEYEERSRELARKGPTALVALTIHNWLSDWLRSHVGGEDQELARFLAARAR